MGSLRKKNSPFHRIGNAYGNFLDPDHFMGRSAFEDSWIAPPKANISENGKGYAIELIMPGIDKKEIFVATENGILEVDVDPDCNAIQKYIHQGIQLKLEKQVFEIPKDVDEKHIIANLKNGILEIKLPYKKGAIHTTHHVKVT